MSVVKYIVPALAALGGVAAQSSNTCSAATTTIQNNGDASNVARCTTFTGSIAIATGTTGDISLNGLQTIQGSLIANNVTGMTSLSGSTLQTITDSFSLQSLTILTTLNFPQLTNVQTIDWNVLNALQYLSFGTQGVQEASSVSIQDTQLNSLNGINLQEVDTMFIANNNYLNEINMQLGNITQALTLQSNGRNVSATFPNLIWAYNMTIRNVTTFSSPSLASLNGSFGFYSNEVSSINAPNLTTVGGALSFVSNTDLTSLSMPMLRTVNGGLQVANNTELDTVSFPMLRTIGGALDFNGNFSNVSLPALTDVKGAFNLQSSADISNICSNFRSLSGQNNVIKGTFTCAGEQSHPGGAGTKPSGTATGSGSSSSSTGKSAAVNYKPAALTGVMGLVAALFSML
ncbi:hypothetical protein MBLNU457_g0352t1 [Dothideomycetes sp. NU457]